jgi:hypothetical protein
MRTYPLIAVLSLVLLQTFVVAFADSQSYTPPPQRGDIYVVVRYRLGGMGGMYAQPTSLSISWGAFKKSDKIRPPQVGPGKAMGAKGFVLKLRHTKNDSVELSVGTDGRITQGPYQGSPPSEWSDGDYSHVEW